MGLVDYRRTYLHEPRLYWKRMNGALPEPHESWAVFLDFDGTLVELAKIPNGVVVEEELVALLRRLRARLGGALALVSGRPLADLDRLLSPLSLPTAGVHGAERRKATGEVENTGSRTSDLERAVEAFNQLALRLPGVVVEDKGVAIGIHYRQSPDAEPEVYRAVEAQLGLLGPEYRLQRGKRVLEVRPAGADKGRAVEQFMQEAPFAGRLPVYAGDDITDEHAFEAVNRLGGHSIRVGSGDATCARWRVGSVGEFRRWLATLVESSTLD